MMFSKSFGYALRSILYIAENNEKRKRIQLQEIADKLNLPKHFLGKVMKWLVKERILLSTKGPFGGFSLSIKTLNTTLYELIAITGEAETPDACVLHMGPCNARQPCALHTQAESLKNKRNELLHSTTISSLLSKEKRAAFDKIMSN
jgi:Rrf2 family transcriptional regulator, iron-sulfur cluster assembly transcription factor